MSRSSSQTSGLAPIWWTANLHLTGVVLNFLNGRKSTKTTRENIMQRFVFSLVLIVWVLNENILFADAFPVQSVNHLISGPATNGLKAEFLIEKYSRDWTIELDFISQTNFSQYAWLKTTNRVGAKLTLWIDGLETHSTNADALNALRLPSETTVSKIMNGVRLSSRRGLQWWRTKFDGSHPGESYPSTSFSLGSVFNFSPTNEIVIQIAPLIYKVEADEVAARLVEFPPTKIKLLPDGDVQKIE
jgi:hypothetical protein